MKTYHASRMPFLLRLIGCKYIGDNGARWRMKWGELNFGTWGLALDYTASDDAYEKPHIHFRVPGLNFFFYMPWQHVAGEPADPHSWGFYWYESALWLKWRQRCKALHAPWAWEHVRHDVLMADGTWKRVAKYCWGSDKDDNSGRPWEWTDKHQEVHPYTYVLRNGEVQARKATVGVEEREWRWRWFTWLPFPRKIRRTIDVKFDDEVGERSGTWKGGCLGCGENMRPDERAVDTLKRMERERKF